MLETVNILTGSTFVTSDRLGDIDGSPTSPHGLFASDTRFLSRWKMAIDDRPLAVLSVDEEHYYATQFFLAPSTGTTYVDSPMSVLRRRSIGESMWEEIGLFNHSPGQIDCHLHIDVAADFADLFEVKDALAKKGELYSRVEGDGIVLGYVRETFRRETHIHVEAPGANITENAIDVAISLAPHGQWIGRFEIVPHGGLRRGQAARATPDEARSRLDADAAAFHRAAPRLSSNWRVLERAYDRTVTDLSALRLRLENAPDATIPAAGLPWFMSLFGRDSIITSYQAIWMAPELALSTLRTLASMQGTRVDLFRDEEPGKIPHELRFGELTAFEERPHSPYYGSADSTTLWLILLDEYERWTGREDVVRELEPAARRALEWIDRYGDRDGDGYIEYQRGIEATGLDNQCWKDSWDSIRFTDGRIARLPRATCELQGYAYDAKMRSARLARDIWGDAALAASLEASAAALKTRFNEDFWLPDRGYFGIALDGDKRLADSLTSNIGHLMWSGIVDDDKAQSCATHLMSDSMFSGWGTRTMALGEGAYNPIGYHVGTVWPHDTSIVAMGLARYGFRAEASRLAQAMLEASDYFRGRLPEAFAGYPREATHYPAEYPTACSPQAWATGAPPLMIRAMLGMEPAGSQLMVDPYLPPAISDLSLSGVPGRWGQTQVSGDAAATLVAALETASSAAPRGIRELFETLDRANLPAARPGSGATGSIGFHLGDAGDWLLAVQNGRVHVQEGFADADCVLETTEPTLLSILHGEQNTRTAVLSGKVAVTGDIELATRLGKVLTPSA